MNDYKPYKLTTQVSQEDAKITEELQKLIRAEENTGKAYTDEKAKKLCERARMNWPEYEDRLQNILKVTKEKELEAGPLTNQILEFVKEIAENTRKPAKAEKKTKAEQEAEEEMRKESVKKSYAPIKGEPLTLPDDVLKAIRSSHESDAAKNLLERYFIAIKGNGKQTADKVHKTINQLNSFTGIEAEKMQILEDGIKYRRPYLKPLHDVPASPEQLERFQEIARQ